MSPRNFFYDTEFLEDGYSIELISIGIVADDGREYYAVNADMDARRIYKDRWLRDNVWPHLPVQMNGGLHTMHLDMSSSLLRPKWLIANEVRDFIVDCLDEGDDPRLWADYAAYDHVALAQLYGKMIDLPAGIPMFTHELRQLLSRVPGSFVEPKQFGDEHNALADARHARRLFGMAMDAIGDGIAA